jgi:predicted nucleic-acid-binding protein
MRGKAAVLPDTNTILRYLLKDNQEQYAIAAEFFEYVRIGQKKAEILEGVLLECVYVLQKFYQIPRQKTAATLGEFLLYKGVVNRDRDLLGAALQNYAATTLDMVDCLLLAHAKIHGSEIFTFDKVLAKQATVE